MPIVDREAEFIAAMNFLSRVAFGQHPCLGGVVVEEGADVERPLGGGADERAGHRLLDLVQARLVPVVVLGPVLHRQPHLPPRPGRRLQRRRGLVVRGAPQVHVVHRHDLGWLASK